jgi:hypothetical protein
MGKAATYETDIVAWADEQAALLRDAARRAPLASNQIDWDNIAEEIETVGRSETRAVMSAIRLVFVHIIKLAAVPQSQAATHWRSEIITWLGDIHEDYTPSMAAKIQCDALWQRALREANAALADVPDVVTLDALPKACPFTLAELLDDRFNLNDAIAALTPKDHLA